MDNYKIKVKDEAESKEAQELFVQLGYELDTFFGNYEASTKWVLACTDGSMGCASDGMVKDTLKEITFPQLRDIVVLKCNDVKDATHRDKRDETIYLTSEMVIYYWQGEWCKSAINKSNDYENYIANSLTPINQPQDPALISVDDVWKAFWKEQEVQYSFDDDNNWKNDITSLKIEDIKSGHYQFRLKPTTLTVNAELPKPQKETQHNSLVYAVTYEFKTREERNSFAEKLRGTNS